MKDDQQNYTERLDQVYIDMQDAICTSEELDQIFQVVRESWSKSSKFSHLRELRDKLNVVGISSEEDRELSYYRDLVTAAKRRINSGNSQISLQLLKHLCQCYMEYPTPGAYMQRLVDRLSGDSDPWKDDTLRLRILKRFIREGNYLNGAGFGGRQTIRNYVKEKTGKAKLTRADVLENLDDGIFALLESGKPVQKENMTKEERDAWREDMDAWTNDRKSGGKYGLLKTVNDLAEGNFPSGGTTRERLYLFAMAYNMTWYRSGGTEVMDERTDIEKNLFQDYYANNVMRFLSAAYHNTPEAYENPNDQGINSKNFAEAIYLYFIRQQKYGPAEKIKLAGKMIDRVKNAPGSASTGGTTHYRNLLGENGLDLSILNLSEEDFEAYVQTHYNCNTLVPRGPGSPKNPYFLRPLAVEPAQNTAFQKYQEILEKLREISRKRLLRAEKCSTCEKLPYYDWTLEYAYEGIPQEGVNMPTKRTHPAHRADTISMDIQMFEELIRAADRMLGHTPKVEKKEDSEQAEKEPLSRVEKKIRMKEKGIAALSITSAKEMSRSALITVYYYYFNALHDDQKQMEQDLDRFWICFTDEINGILGSAYYPPMSSKNIGDVLTVYAAYVLQIEKSSAE